MSLAKDSCMSSQGDFMDEWRKDFCVVLLENIFAE